ncbi:MAG: winged helix-turn-helix domain-containing protein [Candidatus Gracilibacteria bacterium]
MIQDLKILKYKSIVLHLNSRVLHINKNKIFLRNKEFSLMEYFLKNIGMILTRTQILEDVWDMNICCATNTIDVHVSRLRKKLKNLFKKDLIKTVHCIGYLFGE